MPSIREQRTLFFFFKRALDILVSFFGLVLLFPVFIVIGIVIKTGSHGTVLYRQQRVGQNGKEFFMYKFRTMTADADTHIDSLQAHNNMKGNIFKMKDDPRITQNGRILRKTSLDELPQLFNVLRGDMSLVGPRPPLVREYVRYEGWHTLRLSVKPGMTGLWQTRGRNSVHFNDMLRLDFQYIRERGFVCDILIILKTVPLLLGDEHAY